MRVTKSVTLTTDTRKTNETLILFMLMLSDWTLLLPILMTKQFATKLVQSHCQRRRYREEQKVRLIFSNLGAMQWGWTRRPAPKATPCALS